MKKTTPRLGDMQIIDMGGSHIALFKNLMLGNEVEVRRFHSTNTVTAAFNNKPYIGYTHAALFGIGRNSLITRFMHPYDQQKIADAKNAMIDLAQKKRQENLIESLGVTGIITPRP